MIKPDPAVRQAIIASIKTELMKVDWWDEVQEDVRTSLEGIIDHVDRIGTLFSRSFMILFRWEFERRHLKTKGLTSPYAGYVSSLLGMRISEEAYQCGILPTRAVLDIYDYVRPNDSDVAACLFLCHKIEVLELMGALVHDDEKMKTTPSEMAQVIKAQVKKRKRTPKKNPTSADEKIMWDFDD